MSSDIYALIGMKFDIMHLVEKTQFVSCIHVQREGDLYCPQCGIKIKQSHSNSYTKLYDFWAIAEEIFMKDFEEGYRLINDFDYDGKKIVYIGFGMPFSKKVQRSAFQNGLPSRLTLKNKIKSFISHIEIRDHLKWKEEDFGLYVVNPE